MNQATGELVFREAQGQSTKLTADKRGEVPEWPKGADCKSAGDAFEGSNPSLSTIFCGNSSVGRARAFQARGRGFESRFPLHSSMADGKLHMAKLFSGSGHMR